MGWLPITPIGFALHGVRQVYSIDTQDLLDREQVVATLKHYQKLLRGGRIVTRRDDALDRVSALLAPTIPWSTSRATSSWRSCRREAGFRILEEDNSAEPQQLERVTVAPRFRHDSKQDLAVYDTWMISQRDG